MEIRGNTLPSSEHIRLAIREWWKGGGVTNLVVNVCRREMATLPEAEEVARRLALKVANSKGTGWVTDEVVGEQLEFVRALASLNLQQEETEAKSPHPAIGSTEWYRRATERALRSRELFGGEEGYRKQLEAWKRENARELPA